MFLKANTKVEEFPTQKKYTIYLFANTSLNHKLFRNYYVLNKLNFKVFLLAFPKKMKEFNKYLTSSSL